MTNYDEWAEGLRYAARRLEMLDDAARDRDPGEERIHGPYVEWLRATAHRVELEGPEN